MQVFIQNNYNVTSQRNEREEHSNPQIQKIQVTANEALKRKAIEKSSTPKRNKFDKVADYAAKGRGLAKKIIKLTPEQQKRTLGLHVSKNNPYAGYLLSELLLSGEPSQENKEKAIDLLKNFLSDVKKKLGKIDLDSELSEEYFYAHFLLGKHLEKEAKVYLLEAAKHDDYFYDAQLIYGDELEKDEDWELAIDHWRSMKKTLVERKYPLVEVGVICNRLGSALVWCDEPLISVIEEAVKAFEDGMDCGNEYAKENWEKYKPLVPVDIEKFIDEQSESELSEIEEPEIEKLSIRDEVRVEQSNFILNTLKEAACYGNNDAIYGLAALLTNGNVSIQPNLVEALPYWKELASKGHIQALYQIATWLTEGNGPMQSNLATALPYWEELAQRGVSVGYIKQIEILATTQLESLDLCEKIIVLARRLKEVDPELINEANEILSVYLFKKAQILLKP